MRTDELKEALTDTASTVDIPFGFTERVIQGGRRRRRRRRLAILATALSTVTAVGLGTVAWQFLNQLHPDQLVADARFSQEALGSLAGDAGLRREAVNVFTRDWPRSRLRPTPQRKVDLLGEPHVYWAGDSTGGPTVVLLHRVWVAERDSWQGTMLSLVGKDPASGQTRLLGVDLPERAGGPAGAFLFGPGDRTLLVVAQNRPMTFSPGIRVATDGTVTRESQTLIFSQNTAQAVVPPEMSPAQSVLVSEGRVLLRPQLASEHLWYLAQPPDAAAGKSPRQPRGTGWSATGGRLQLQASEPFLPRDTLRELATAELLHPRYRDPFGTPEPTHWELVAGLSGNRSLYLSEVADSDPSRVYGVVFLPDKSVQAVRFAGPGAGGPLSLRLSGNEGWVVAHPGTELEWRADKSAQWQRAGRDAALLPATARHIRSTSRLGSEEISLY